MSEVLYRKYRPQKFSDVLGQDHIVSVLEAQVKSGDISHAYLFSGTRGTGKTSVARIFAKSIGTTPNDIYEIDAASNTSVDDIRSLNESVNTLPFESKYKVYILDEVHMLSKSASNALLKTLEEPPAHVVFILATTETHKILETILSRCQTFTFKKPSSEVLKKVVQSVAKKEGFSIESSSADLIAMLGDGSFRDTLGIVQKIITSSPVVEQSSLRGVAKDKNPSSRAKLTTGRGISEEEVLLVTGAPKIELVRDVISAISEKDLEKGLSAVALAKKENIDMTVFLKLILHSARAVLLFRFGSSGVVRDDMSEHEIDFISKIAEKDQNFSSKVLIELLSALEKTTGAYIPSLPLELALISIIKNQ